MKKYYVEYRRVPNAKGASQTPPKVAYQAPLVLEAKDKLGISRSLSVYLEKQDKFFWTEGMYDDPKIIAAYLMKEIKLD